MTTDPRSTKIRERKRSPFRVRWGALVAQVALGIVLALMAQWALTILTDPPAPVPTPTSLPACETEDSTGCYWDAQTMGNGRGQDVVTLEPEPEVNEDHGGLPACTDAIADAGGMCWGEPR